MDNIVWEKLVDTSRVSLGRGALLKFPAKFPFEDQVIMMVCQGPDKQQDKCLITITGYKAGFNPYVIFPDEAIDVVHVSCDWLRLNWNKWVWPYGDVNDVLVRDPLSPDEI